MVSQEESGQKRRRRPLALTVPLGFLGVAALALWISSPRIGALGADLFNREDRPPLSVPSVHPAVSQASLAIVNPNNEPAARAMRVPDTLPVSDKNGDGESADALDGIVVVTPTPGGQPDTAAASDPAAGAESVSGPQSGLVLAGQQEQAVDPVSDVPVDPAALSELLQPLLQDQINPTPLVIELEIPSNGSARRNRGIRIRWAEGPVGFLRTPADRAPAHGDGNARCRTARPRFPSACPW